MARETRDKEVVDQETKGAKVHCDGHASYDDLQLVMGERHKTLSSFLEAGSTKRQDYGGWIWRVPVKKDNG